MTLMKCLSARTIRFGRLCRRTTVKIAVAILIVCVLCFILKTFPYRANVTAVDKFDADLIRKVDNNEKIASKVNVAKISKRQRPTIDCSLLIKGDHSERLKAVKFQDANPKRAIPESEYIARVQECHNFIAENDYYISSPLPGEIDFPLAFSILMYKDIEQFERLLRAIYRPQNFYCIHVDRKSSSTLHLAVKSISRCFDNVFVLENQVEVIWGSYSVLEPEILCMEALLKYKKWKYFINLTGQEFPLKTNWELVQILKAINGSNLVSATRVRQNPERFEGRPPCPILVRVYKGPVHVVVRREFVEYAITNNTSRKYLNWVKRIGHPDEYFFSTLNHNPQLNIPGSYLGIPETDIGSYNYPFINRYKVSFLKHPTKLQNLSKM